MFVQGYIAKLTVNGQDLEVFASDATLTLTNDVLDKTTLGITSRQYIPGLQDGTLGIQMHLDTAGVGLLQAAYAAAAEIPFVVRPGKVGGPDAGEWAGTCIVTDLEITGSVDDNWQMNLAGQVTGPVTYTQPA